MKVRQKNHHLRFHSYLNKIKIREMIHKKLKRFQLIICRGLKESYIIKLFLCFRLNFKVKKDQLKNTRRIKLMKKINYKMDLDYCSACNKNKGSLLINALKYWKSLSLKPFNDKRNSWKKFKNYKWNLIFQKTNYYRFKGNPKRHNYKLLNSNRTTIKRINIKLLYKISINKLKHHFCNTIKFKINLKIKIVNRL